MSRHFAAVEIADQSPVARILRFVAPERAANDNLARYGAPVPNEQMLRAALRHFAQYGLGAARAARARAEEAFFAGDRAAYDWWLGITRTLDRRLAAQAEQVVPAAQNDSSSPVEIDSVEA
ncbi:hypothetical protein [Erythrobacter sp. JK5]|uniref:hypothetical protein n=1 Tax=Erythrobacter sp. JK5 TaxID=2829500 RepID=UPI001BAC385C|nr:hypothetical protein [Erythrobacter sp. JK5]QUL38424.1 hypothetical protein KDC96_03130 [Erythrobacter sp. JK5]